MESFSKKSQILKSAIKIFLEKGFKAASISTIAKEANVPQSLIYHHFKNKEDLFWAVKNSVFEESHMEKDFGAGETTNLTEFLTTVLTKRLDFYQRHPEVHRLLLWQSLESTAIEPEKSYLRMWIKKIDEFKAAGEVNALLDSKCLALQISFALMPAYTLTEQFAFDAKAYLGQLIEILYRGMKTINS